MQVTGEGSAANIPEHKQDGDGMDCDVTMPLLGNHLSGGVRGFDHRFYLPIKNIFLSFINLFKHNTMMREIIQ
uniref:Uncharacterized protein n=1 Tax=Anguilla anguilla TaxID=7936 RepID=A0A0E9WHA9_ANGAN